jgi:hypothetical protein
LESLESLVKIAKKKKDEVLKSINSTKVEGPPTVCRINIHKNSDNKTLHLLVELNNNLFEGLVDTNASMSIMSTIVVCELGIMHIVFKSKAYKTTSIVVNQAFGKIINLLVKFGLVQCLMMFMIVDINSYDLLLGLDFLIKICVVFDVENKLIQNR